MLFLLAVVCAARRSHRRSYAKMLEMLNNGDTENYEVELAKLKSRNSGAKNRNEKERFEKAALAELDKISFYMRLLTDKFVPKAEQEKALQQRLQKVKARLEKPSK